MVKRCVDFLSGLRDDPRPLDRLSLVTALSLVALIGSGGWVRLSESGLGCPTWPRCTTHDLVAPDHYHALVEFVNRCVITTVGVLIAATVVAAFLKRPRRADLRWLAAGLVAGYAGEAVLGGMTVLLHLAPALVAGHLILAMALLADAVVLHWRSRPPRTARHLQVDRHLLWLADLAIATLAAGIVAGTVVTGSGPHSGAPGTPRFDVRFSAAAELHATIGMLLFGLAVSLFLGLRAMAQSSWAQSSWAQSSWAQSPRTQSSRLAHQAAAIVGLLTVQGMLGYATYFSRVQVDLTEAHIVGAALTTAALVRLRLGLTASRATRPSQHEQPVEVPEPISSNA